MHGRNHFLSDLYFSKFVCCTGQLIFACVHKFNFLHLITLVQKFIIVSYFYCDGEQRSRTSPQLVSLFSSSEQSQSLLHHVHFRQSSYRPGEEPQSSRPPIKSRSGSHLDTWWLLLQKQKKKIKHVYRYYTLFWKLHSIIQRQGLFLILASSFTKYRPWPSWPSNLHFDPSIQVMLSSIHFSMSRTNIWTKKVIQLFYIYLLDYVKCTKPSFEKEHS